MYSFTEKNMEFRICEHFRFSKVNVLKIPTVIKVYARIHFDRKHFVFMKL